MIINCAKEENEKCICIVFRIKKQMKYQSEKVSEKYTSETKPTK
jgi:hypothetical protein